MSRNYSSIGARYGQLGNKWRFSWERELTVYASNSIGLVMADGSDVNFTLIGGVYRPSSTPPTATELDITATRLTTPVEAYEIRDEADRVERYELVVGTFRLKSIRERSGYTQTFAYDAAGRVTSISDTSGRTLTLTYEPLLPSPGTDNQRVVTQIDASGGFRIAYTFSRATSSTATTMYQSTILTQVVVSNPVTNPGVSETTTYHYEKTGEPWLLTGVTDARGVRYATFTYDSYGRVIVSEHVGSNDKTTFSFDDVAKTTTVTNALGKSATYSFQTINGKQLISSVSGQPSLNCPASSMANTYDGNGRVTSRTDEEGRVTQYVLDARGLPTSVTRGFGTPQAVSTGYSYHASLHVPTQMVEPGRTTNYTWDAATGRLSSMSQVDTTTTTVPYSTNGQTRTWAYTYTTAAGLLASVDGPLAGTGDTVSYTYDASGYVKTVTNEVGHVTTVNTVNGRGQPTQITDPNGVVSNLGYDFQGRLLTVTVNPGASQAVTTMTYDAVGQVTKVTRPDGSYLAYTYDNARRLTTVTSNTNETLNYTYDLMGNVTSRVIKNGSGTITFNQTQTFDELGRLLKHIGANAQTTTYGYEKNDNLKSVTDPRSGLYAYAYDSLNRLIRETDQENSQVNLTRDGQDNVTTYSDPRSLATTYVRNGFGEVIRETSPDRGVTDTVRDLRGLPTQITDGRGIVTNLTYDNSGRVLSKVYPAATAENVTYTYDDVLAGNKGKGRLTKITDQSGSTAFVYDARGNVVTETRTIATKVHTIAYVYDLADRVTQITYPSGRIVTYTRDTVGRVTGVTTKLNAAAATVSLASGIAYQPMSNLVQSLTYGNGLNDWNTYTLDYELDVLGVYNGATSVINRAHTHTDALNLTNIWDNVTTANNQTFAYSAANRMASASGAYGASTWTYDGVGNRKSEVSTPPGGSAATRTLGYPAGSNRVSNVVIGTTTERAFAVLAEPSCAWTITPATSPPTRAPARPTSTPTTSATGSAPSPSAAC